MRSWHAQIFGKVVQLVFVLEATQLHGLFVQRCKTDGIDFAALGAVHAQIQHLEHCRAASGQRLAALHVCWRNGVHSQKGRQALISAAAHFSQRRNSLRGNTLPGDGLAVLPQPRVADQHDIGVVRDVGLAQQAGDQLGADAGCVAQGQGDDGVLLHVHGVSPA